METHRRAAADTLPPEAIETIMRQTMEIYVAPEIERRRATGRWVEGTEISSVQVEMSPTKEIPIVRLNAEVPTLAKAKLKPGVRKRKGEPILAGEIESISDLQFPEPRDPNAGHITMVFVIDTWHVAFDFVYNKKLAGILLERAEQFLVCGSEALQREHFSAASENLYACFDLAAKAFLLALKHPTAQSSKKHEATRVYFNVLGRREFSHPLNKLSDLRHKARYGEEVFQVPTCVLSEYYKSANKLVANVKQMITRRQPRSDNPSD